MTVSFRLDVFRYDVTSFLTNRSPMVSSTLGGSESGILPSLEGRCEVAEKARLLWTPPVGCAVVGVVVEVVWKAGTRKLGRVTVEEGLEATARCRACRPILGANIAATAGWGTGGARCGGRDSRWLMLPLLKKRSGVAARP